MGHFQRKQIDVGGSKILTARLGAHFGRNSNFTALSRAQHSNILTDRSILTSLIVSCILIFATLTPRRATGRRRYHGQMSVTHPFVKFA